MKRLINTFILSTIGIIFIFDAFVYVLGNDTISEQITTWINDGNQLVFGGIVIALVAHFWFGKYKE